MKPKPLSNRWIEIIAFGERNSEIFLPEDKEREMEERRFEKQRRFYNKEDVKSACEFLIEEIKKGDWEVWSCGRSTDYADEYCSKESKEELIKLVKLAFRGVL